MQGQVEDTKGNNGEVGQLHITNLRLIWTSQRSVRMNLTVGYDCIVSMNIRQAASRLRGARCWPAPDSLPAWRSASQQWHAHD